MLLKVEFVNLPVSIPEPWRQFFDQTAARMGCSRNYAICLALKIGGPILDGHVKRMRDQLKAEIRRIQKAHQVSKILGLPPRAPSVVANGHHERRKNRARAS